MIFFNFLIRYARAAVHGIKIPLQTAYENRYLLSLLIKRDIQTRTSGTLLGSLWLLLQPALQILGFWFLLGMVLKVKFSGGIGFGEYFLVGILAWLFISEVLGRSLSILSEFGGIYRRAVFPVALLPLLPLFSSGGFYMLCFLLVVGLLHGFSALPNALIVIPLLALWLMPFCYLLAVIGLFLKDIAQFFPFLITAMLYLTPILYTPDLMPEALYWLLYINPLADLMALIHASVQGFTWHIDNLWRPILIWVLVLAPAWVLYRRSEPHIREML